MEQAAVYLRQSKLTDAYQPPQVEALKLLVDAKKLVDEALKKAQDEQKANEQESIRQAYVKLLEDQKSKVDEPTKTVEAGRDAEGNPKREDGIRLLALPGDQGKLADRAEALGKNLEALNSIVYKWANKDIITSMGEVKEDLAKPRTDKVVQTQQVRIEEQLAAMIESLKKMPPKKDEFAKRDGGGGSGSGQGQPPPKMPTDVELRLLKALQGAVNKATVKIDDEVKAAAGKKDQPKLAGLGGRQGELRNLLDQLLQEASKGQVKLGDEPDDKIQLPEEASKSDVDDQEYFNDLLKKDKVDAPAVEKIVKAAGDRMGRSRQRLAIKNDPGQVTQEIQKRIVVEFDNLIALAQKQQQQGGGKPQPKPGDKPGGPQPGDQGQQQAGKGQQPGQQQPNGQQAAGDTYQGGSLTGEDVSKILEEKGVEWGKLFLRDNGPMRNAAGEQHSPKYDKYISDYYKDLAKKASEQK
jgi:hypothetical protein